MAGQQSGNRARVRPFDLNSDALSLGDWAVRRNVQFGQGGQALQLGHLRALGMQPLSAQLLRVSPSPVHNPDERRDQRGRRLTGGVVASQSKSWMDLSLEAKAIGGAAWAGGLVLGVPRGAWHALKDVVHGVEFYSRLKDPYDALKSPPGYAAWDKVFRAGKGLVDYATSAISNPEVVVDDVGQARRGINVKTNPFARPPADTLQGEAARNFNIGLNGGEALFDAASLLYGGAEAKVFSKVGAISKEAEGAKYLARGYPERLSNYFAEPYDGMGHHFLPRRTRLPVRLGGGHVPPVISDSPFFLLRPRNVSKGDFYERHFQVDPSYYGGKISDEFGRGGWSGQRLGWTKYDKRGRLWYGSPAPLKKAVAGAGMFGMGGVVDQIWNGEGQP